MTRGGYAVLLAAGVTAGGGWLLWSVDRGAPDPPRKRPPVVASPAAGPSPTETSPAAPEQAAPTIASRFTFHPSPEQAPSETSLVLEEVNGVVEQLVRDYPRLTDSLEVQARVLAWSGQTQQAVEVWQRSLQLDPKYAHAFLGLGRAAADEARYDEAIQHYRAALQVSPQFGQAELELARTLLDAGQSADAREFLEQRRDRVLQSAEACCLWGQAAAREGDHAAARDAYQAALRLDGQMAEAHYGLAMALARLGERQAAQESLAAFQQYKNDELALRRQQRLDFDDLQAAREDVAQFYTSAARIYQTQGDAEAARLLCRRAALLDPRHIESRQALAWMARAADDLTGAVRWLEELALLQPNDMRYWLEIGDLHRRQNRWQEARQAYQRAAEAEPSAAEPIAAQAELELQIGGDPARAVELARQAVAREGAAPLHFLLATALRRQGDLSAATEAMRTAVQQASDPNVYRGQYRQLQGLRLKNESWQSLPAGETPLPAAAHEVFDELEMVLQRAIESFPGDPEPLAAQAHYYAWRGLHAQAQQTWQRCLNADPRFLPALMGMARATEQQGNDKQAERWLRQAHEAAPADPVAAAALGRLLSDQGRAEEIPQLFAKVPAERLSAAAHVLLGDAALQRRDLKAAQQHYTRAVALDANLVEAHYGLSLVARQAGRADDARRHTDRFQHLMHQQRQARQQARTDYDDLLALRADAARQMMALAHLFAERQAPEPAQRLRQRAMALDADAAGSTAQLLSEHSG